MPSARVSSPGISVLQGASSQLLLAAASPLTGSMAEAENKIEREESIVTEGTVTGAPKVTEQSPVAMVSDGVEDAIGVAVEGENDNSPTKEDEKKKSTVREKRGTPGRVKKLVRQKKKAPGNDGDADPSGSAPVKVEENVSAVVNESNKGKKGDEGVNNDGKEVADKDNDEKIETPKIRAVLAVSAAPAAVTTEIAKDNGGEEVSDKEKVDSALSKKNKKRKNKKKAHETAEETAGNAEVGAIKKTSDAKGPAGMIFMCSSKTKKECYRYKIFGMPAGRKEVVSKVYKGMKLFLFDIDLKLLYGIYLATSKGGYDIRPKAFNSAFPSQVRFKILKEYPPLAQEKFKAAIKANYYKKNMFSCELSTEQVQKLTKLFVEATKASKPMNSRASGKRVSESIISHEAKRRRDRYERDAYASQPTMQASYPALGSTISRHAPLPLYSSPPRVAALPPPPPAYAYERPAGVDVDYYRRELEARGYRVVDPEPRPQVDHAAYNDPYSLYREPTSYPETRLASTLPAGYYGSAPSSYRY